MTKRLLSWLLVFVMVLGMLPTAAFAAETGDGAEAVETPVVEENLPESTTESQPDTEPDAEPDTEPEETQEDVLTPYSEVTGTPIFSNETDGTWSATNVGIATLNLSGAMVKSYAWSGDTCNVVLGADTAKDAALTLQAKMAGGGQPLVQHQYNIIIDGVTTGWDNTGTVTLAEGTKTFTVSLVRSVTTTKTFVLTVEEANAAPTLAEGVNAEVDAYVGVGRTYRVHLPKLFTDADGDKLTYTVKVGDAEPVSTDNNYAYTPAAQGVYTLVFTASDGKATVTYTVKLHANPDTSIFATGTDGTWDSGAVYVKNLYVSGADVESYTWDGDTCNVVLAAGTAQNAPIAFWVSRDGKSNLHLAQHFYSIVIDGVTTDIHNTGLVYLENGQKTVVITLSSASSATKTIVFTIAPSNHAPTLAEGVNAAVDSYIGVGRYFYVDLSKIFTDADGDELTYTVKVGDAEPVSTEKKYTYVPAEQGAHTLVFTASDGEATATHTITLHVNPETNIFTAETDGTWASGAVFVQNLYLSGAEVESYTWDGDTCNVVLAAGTAANAPITFFTWLSGNGMYLAQHLYSIVIDGVTTDRSDSGTVYLSEGQRTVQISLSRGTVVTKTIVLTVSTGNQAPSLVEGVNATAEASVNVGSAYNVDLSKIFTDADGDALSYTVQVNEDAAVSAGESYSFTPDEGGRYTLVFTASDGKTTATYTVTLTAKLAANVTLTINDAGNLVVISEAVAVTDTDDDGILTYHDALVIVHEKYKKDYVADEGGMGRFVTVLWGKNTGGNNLFYINDDPIKLSVGTDTIAEGDYLYACTLQDSTNSFSDYYSYFTDRYVAVETGKDFTLTLKGFAGMSFGGATSVAVSGVSVGTWEDGAFHAMDGKTTDADGKVTLRFNQPGSYVVTATGAVSSTDWLGNPVNAPLMSPVCIVTVTGEAVEPEPEVTPYLSKLVFTASFKDQYVLNLSPAFNPTTGKYTLYIPEYLSNFYIWATLNEGQTGEITACYTTTGGSEKCVAVTSGKTSGTALSQCVGYNSLEGNTVTIKVGEEVAYTIQVERAPSLKSLKLTLADGTPVELDPAYYYTTTEYTAFLSKDDVVTVAAVARLSDATVTINGGTETTLTPAWNDHTFDLLIQVTSADGVVGTYTVHLYENALSVSVNTPPTRTEYAMGDTFDPAGMTLLASYADGTTKVLTPDMFTCEPAGSLSASVKEITASFGGVTAQQPITVTAPFTGSGTAEDPFQLKTQEDMETLSACVKGGMAFSGEYFKMMNPIELVGTWEGIGDSTNPFSGDFDGGGFQLSIPEGGKAVFSRTRGAVIHDLKVYGPRIDDCALVSNYVVDKVEPYYAKFYRVTLVSGTKTLKSGFIGGYASGQDQVWIEDCLVEKGVVIGYDKSQSRIGSFGGDFNGTITGCVSYADVYGVDFVGGICGDKGQTMATFDILGCKFYGNVIASGNYVGGICGHGYGGTSWGIDSAPNTPMVTIKNCECSGSVTGANYVGGILGAETGMAQCWANGIGYLQDNRFTGTLNGSGQYVAGIAGYIRSLNRYTNISNNYYTGAAKGIGGVEFVDTNCTTHETESGAVYFSTEFDTNGCPSVKYCSWKTQHNRTDDPLGADANKLCYTDAVTEPVPTGLTVSGTFKTEYVLGEELDLTGIVLTVSFNKGEDKVLELSDVIVGGYDKDKIGDQKVTISYESLVAEIDVTVKNPTKEITVTLSILGDSKHGSSGTVHTLMDKNLTTWLGATAYTIDADSTLWDLLKMVLDELGYSYTNPSGNYISSINGLSEFDNGANSGWMYTLNGTHPLLGVSEMKLKNGDVIVMHYTDDYTKEEGSWTDDDDDAAKAVDALIDKIGTVTLTDDCKAKIDAARSVYKALSAADKKKVTKLPTLEAAEKRYNELKAADDQKKADQVIDLIDKIDKEITLDSEKAIQAARNAYDKLTADQKKLVTNYKKLTDAEKGLAKLKASEEDEKAAEKVSDAIDNLGDITLDSEKKIEDARKEYEKLTDVQKKLVDNLDALEKAEQKLAELKRAQRILDAYKATGDYLEALGTPGVGSVGGEWMAIGLLRSDRSVAEAYYEAVVNYVKENADENERLHRAKSTDNSRIILALTAMGKDVTDVGGHNLLLGLNDLEFVQKQGINGPIWALIALDSGNYPVPAGSVTRQALLELILNAQLEDGGWALSGDEADSDMTGMALQALAPYYQTNEKVKAAADKAVETLSDMQNEDGGFSTFGGNTKVATSESTSQVIVALTALGIDPYTDARFVKNGSSAMDALLSCFVDGGGFRHLADAGLDGMATEQGYYALTAYVRLLNGKTSLYDMTDVVDKGGDVDAQLTEPADTDVAETEPEETVSGEAPAEGGNFPWWILILVLACGVVVVVLLPKKKKQ